MNAKLMKMNHTTSQNDIPGSFPRDAPDMGRLSESGRRRPERIICRG